MIPLDDSEYEEVKVKEVRKTESGYELEREDGWSFFVDDPGFEISPGQMGRFYGEGIGRPVRGLAVDDRICFYRTREEDKQYHLDLLYPRTAVEALKRWDKGQSVSTVSLGGIGPGYEQAIHVAIFELIRDVSPAQTMDSETLDATINRIGGQLGLSGAQAGVAKGFASQVLHKGWQETVLSFPEDRRIQVSNHWPMIKKSEAETKDG